VVKVATVTGNSGQTVTIQCPAATPHATGGGASDADNGATVYGVPVIAGGAVATDGQQATGWKATAATQTNNKALTVYVICAS
jgi:hypothetical protein